MNAATLNCPMCGAAAASDATMCGHCGARLATVECPSCFAMIFAGSKFCQHCGAKVERIEAGDAKPKSCPRCRVALGAVDLGTSHIHECAKCEGLWVDVETFNAICTDREKQAAVLGGATPNPQPAVLEPGLDGIHYVPCPECAMLMNRVNFAGCSGVIVDACKGHGTWFDKDELRQIVGFIRAGGLEKARDRDMARWEAEKRARNFMPGGSVDTGALGGDIGGSDANVWIEAARMGADIIEWLATRNL
jgi:Zn-finger nucleic acid-binding protein